MSTHIGAGPGEVAPHVLLPGDPLRARWIAETFLEDARCYSEVRGMYGYTGTYRGEPVPRSALANTEMARRGTGNDPTRGTRRYQIRASASSHGTPRDEPIDCARIPS